MAYPLAERLVVDFAIKAPEMDFARSCEGKRWPGESLKLVMAALKRDSACE